MNTSKASRRAKIEIAFCTVPNETSLSGLSEHSWSIVRNRCSRGIDWNITKTGRRWQIGGEHFSAFPLFATKRAAYDALISLVCEESKIRTRRQLLAELDYGERSPYIRCMESKRASEMAVAELRREAASYKAEQLGGGEGFNPFQAELDRRDAAAEPKPQRDEYAITRAINGLDWYMVPVAGSREATEYAALQAELATLRASRIK